MSVTIDRRTDQRNALAEVSTPPEAQRTQTEQADAKAPAGKARVQQGEATRGTSAAQAKDQLTRTQTPAASTAVRAESTLTTAASPATPAELRELSAVFDALAASLGPIAKDVAPHMSARMSGLLAGPPALELSASVSAPDLQKTLQLAQRVQSGELALPPALMKQLAAQAKLLDAVFTRVPGASSEAQLAQLRPEQRAAVAELAAIVSGLAREPLAGDDRKAAEPSGQIAGGASDAAMAMRAVRSISQDSGGQGRGQQEEREGVTAAGGAREKRAPAQGPAAAAAKAQVPGSVALRETAHALSEQVEIPGPAIVKLESTFVSNLANLAGMDIEAAIQVVMMQAAKESETDLRELLEDLKKTNKQKQELRAQIASAKKQEADMKTALRDEFDRRRALPKDDEAHIPGGVSFDEFSASQKLFVARGKMQDEGGGLVPSADFALELSANYTRYRDDGSTSETDEPADGTFDLASLELDQVKDGDAALFDNDYRISSDAYAALEEYHEGLPAGHPYKDEKLENFLEALPPDGPGLKQGGDNRKALNTFAESLREQAKQAQRAERDAVAHRTSNAFTISGADARNISAFKKLQEANSIASGQDLEMKYARMLSDDLDRLALGEPKPEILKDPGGPPLSKDEKKELDKALGSYIISVMRWEICNKTSGLGDPREPDMTDLLAALGDPPNPRAVEYAQLRFAEAQRDMLSNYNSSRIGNPGNEKALYGWLVTNNPDQFPNGGANLKVGENLSIFAWDALQSIASALGSDRSELMTRASEALEEAGAGSPKLAAFADRIDVSISTESHAPNAGSIPSEHALAPSQALALASQFNLGTGEAHALADYYARMPEDRKQDPLGTFAGFIDAIGLRAGVEDENGVKLREFFRGECKRSDVGPEGMAVARAMIGNDRGEYGEEPALRPTAPPVPANLSADEASLLGVLRALRLVNGRHPMRGELHGFNAETVRLANSPGPHPTTQQEAIAFYRWLESGKTGPSPIGAAEPKKEEKKEDVQEPKKVDAGQEITLDQLHTSIEALTAKKDTLSELGEEQSLKLQMYQERRSKLFQTLSNIMKKSSDTSGAIISNLK